MKTVDEEVARLSGARDADGAQLTTTVRENIGTALQKIVPIIDHFAGVSALNRPIEPTFNINIHS